MRNNFSFHAPKFSCFCPLRPSLSAHCSVRSLTSQLTGLQGRAAFFANRKILLAFTAFFLFAFSAFAESPFKLSPLKDGILFGTGVALSGSDLILDNALKVNRQEYDGTVYCKDDVNPLDRLFMHEYSKNRDRAADIVLVATMATPAVLALTEKDEWFTCAVMYAETLLISNGVKELAKLAVNRTRPYMYYAAETFPEDDVDDGDWANSFPSGHSTMAFASATFASYTFCKYFPDSALKIPVVAGSYALAGSVAALRLSSGNHFMTDVLAGAAIGSLAGFFVPFLHTFNEKNDLKISLHGNGLSVAVNF